MRIGSAVARGMLVRGLPQKDKTSVDRDQRARPDTASSRLIVKVILVDANMRVAPHLYWRIGVDSYAHLCIPEHAVRHTQKPVGKQLDKAIPFIVIVAAALVIGAPSLRAQISLAARPARPRSPRLHKRPVQLVKPSMSMLHERIAQRLAGSSIRQLQLLRHPIECRA